MASISVWRPGWGPRRARILRAMGQGRDAGLQADGIAMVEELEREYSTVRDKVHDLRSYL